ncbi:hypothetical protein [Acholeplasma granularum]|uniref:hypothetical protein n=1 Tax=Acholeplasma granularum TaxID=264635 RepID=UPI0004BA6FA4|nr:hypothetical protein [Acholeplasma granularum]
MSQKNQRIVIKRSEIKVRDKDFIDKKLKYKMTIKESKKNYNRKKLKQTKHEVEEI